MKQAKEYFLQFISDMHYAGKQSYSELDSDEKAELTAHFLRHNPEWAEDAVPNSPYYSDIVMLTTRYMISGDIDDSIDLANKLKQATVEFCANHVSELFNQEIAEIEAITNLENGLVKSYHHDNGEVYWARR